MVYFNILQNKKLQGRFIPAIHLPGLIDKDDVDTSLLNTNKLILESTIEDIIDYIILMTHMSKEEIFDKILYSKDSTLPMDYIYMKREHEGIEPVYTNVNVSEISSDEKALKMMEQLTTLYKDNKIWEIGELLSSSLSKKDHHIFKRDYKWHSKIINELESTNTPAMVFGAGHIIRTPLDKRDMNLIDFVKTIGYDVEEVVI